jgi:hypothetical protein
MTRPARPRNYLAFQFRELKQGVFPPRRVLDEEEAEFEEEEDEGEELFEPEPDEQVKSLHLVQEVEAVLPPAEEVKVPAIADILSARYLTVKPLVVDYSPGVSLNHQFGLGQPTVRAILRAQAR